MHVSLEVAHRDFPPQGQGRAQAPQEQAILLPDCRAAGAVQGVHRAFVVADKDVTRVERQSRGARQLTRPERVAVRELEAPDPPMVGRGAHFAIGSPTTSVTRSSSVAPRGNATVVSQRTLPLASAIDTSLPPANPVSS